MLIQDLAISVSKVLHQGSGQEADSEFEITAAPRVINVILGLTRFD